MIALGSLIGYRFFVADTYFTGVGEQRTFGLPDGSTVELNSRSKIRVRYANRIRAVDLLQGQALFEVAKDPGRPFIVSSDAIKVRAVGTEFDVYRKRAGTVVSVVEGRVAVCGRLATPAAGGRRRLADALPAGGYAQGSSVPEPGAPGSRQAGGGGPAIVVAAGEQLTVTSESVRKIEHASMMQATAWRRRKLVFDSATLADVADEFNRYSDRQIVVDGSGPVDLRISGVFSITDSESLIRFLRERSDVTIEETPSRSISAKIFRAGRNQSG